MTKLSSVPGVGKTFEKDFARIGIETVEQLAGQSPETVFDALRIANEIENHRTSKNYLYVIRMCIYFADGGRDPAKLKWSFWKG